MDQVDDKAILKILSTIRGGFGTNKSTKAGTNQGRNQGEKPKATRNRSRF